MNSRPRFADSPYPSYAAFYKDVYAQVVTEQKHVTTWGATLLRMRQPAGDWSDAPTPDLGITFLTSRAVKATMDVGSGLIPGPIYQKLFLLTPPNAATTILVDDVHQIAHLALPWDETRRVAGDGHGLPVDGDFGILHSRLNDDRQLVSLFESLWSLSRDDGAGHTLFADGVMLQILSRLLRLEKGPTATRVNSGGLAPWQERRTTEYLADNLAADIALKTLADVAGLSTFHFSRMFKQSTGLPPHAYLRRLRCEKSKALLASTTLSMSEIATQVGYETQQAFARMFRAEVGASPSEYRRNKQL